MSTNRREFLKYTGLGLGTVAVAGLLPWPFRKLSEAEAAEFTDYSRGTWTPSCCNMCGGQCGVRAYVEDGRVRKIEPNPENPNNIANISTSFAAAVAAGDRGRLCGKGNAAIKSLYDADRLRTPLKRVGPRGSGQFVAITWDEALEETARRLYTIKSKHGARSILWFGEDHSFTHIQQDLCDALGTPHYSNHANLCDASRKASYQVAIGDQRPLADMENTDLLFIWGWNFLSAIKWVHLPAIFTRGREQRKFEFLYVDPVFNTTASKADLWITPRPGTDGALALAIARELLLHDNGTGTKYDKAFVEAWTTGLTDFVSYLSGASDGIEKHAAWGEAQSGVPAATIVGVAKKLGDAFAAGKRICIDAWSGPGHHTNATQGGRAIVALALMLGAIDKPGTLFHPLRSSPGRLPGDPTWPAKDGWRLDGKDDVTIPVTEVAPVYSTRDLVDAAGVALAAGTDLRGKKFHKKYLVGVSAGGIYCEARDAMVNQRDFLGIPYTTKAAVFVFQNFVMSTPNAQKNIDAINEMEFVLSVDTHLSETALLADIVVPGSHYLERFDFNAAWVSFRAVGMRQPVIPSWIGGRSEAQFFMDLGATMGLAGFNAAAFRDVDSSLNKKEWEGHIAGYTNKTSWEDLLKTGVWIEDFNAPKGGTQYEKYKTAFTLKYSSKWMHLEGTASPFDVMSGTAKPGGVKLGTTTKSKLSDGESFTVTVGAGYQSSVMHIESVVLGGDARNYVRSGTTSGSGEYLGVGLAPGAADGATFHVGFNTETRLAQFWSKNFNDAWKPGPSKFPGGKNFTGNALYHPLPYYLPPEDAPDVGFPLYFISWKEVEHTHTRTFNNEWLMEMQGENKLYVHPTVAAGKGLSENDRAWVQTQHGSIRVRVHLTEGIQAETVGFVRGFGHWGFGDVARGKGAHDGWLLPGKAEIHSGQAVLKEAACRIYKDLA